MVLAEVWKNNLSNRQKGIKLTIISGKQWSELQAEQWINHEFPFPFVMIDTKILWLGQPLEGVRGIQPPYIAARLHCRRICEYLVDTMLRGGKGNHGKWLPSYLKSQLCPF